MGEERMPEGEGGPERRVYPPHEVQARLQLSASGLRRLAGIFERTVGDLPRDERGRVWPEDAIEHLEDAREAVQSQRAVSIEAALRGQDSPETSPANTTGAGGPYTSPDAGLQGRSDVGAAILEELRALRELVEEQNHRIAELEEVVRTGRPREIEASVGAVEETPAEVNPVTITGLEKTTEPEARERGVWRRLAGWFGFGVHRP
jgi:hypothetical protein